MGGGGAAPHNTLSINELRKPLIVQKKRTAYAVLLI